MHGKEIRNNATTDTLFWILKERKEWKEERYTYRQIYENYVRAK